MEKHSLFLRLRHLFWTTSIFVAKKTGDVSGSNVSDGDINDSVGESLSLAYGFVAMAAALFSLSPWELFAVIGLSSSASVPFEVEKFVAQVSQLFDQQKNRLLFLAEPDPCGRLYQTFRTKAQRKALGEFYTPEWLADYLCRRIVHHLDVNTMNPEHHLPLLANKKFLDPTCGSGIFLLAIMRMLQRAGLSPLETLDHLTGYDISPLTVTLAKTALFIEMMRVTPLLDRPRLWETVRLRASAGKFLPVYCYDLLTDDSKITPTDHEKSALNVQPALRDASETSKQYDVILGNPPWLNWDQLTPARRTATKALWWKYGLFNLSGREGKLGGGKKELAALMLYQAADRHLKERGLLSMVLPMTLFQSQKSGDGFRCLQLGEQGEHLALLEIGDWSSCSPFPEVSSKVSTVLIKKGEKTVWPIPCFSRVATNVEIATNNVRKRLACPSTNSKSSGLIFFDSENGSAIVRSPSDYTAQLGCNTGGANGVYWFVPAEKDSFKTVYDSKQTMLLRNLTQGGKHPLESIVVALEEKLVFPLLRWKDIDTFQAVTRTFVLLPQDPETRKGFSFETMTQQYPLALCYLQRFKAVLSERAMFRKLQSHSPVWSMYNVNQTTFAPFKVVWRRMDSILRAAAVLPDVTSGKPIIPQETISMVAVDSPDEADYLATVLNSEEIRQRANSLSVAGSKGFGSPGLLSPLGIRRYDPALPSHQDLAQQGRDKRVES